MHRSLLLFALLVACAPDTPDEGGPGDADAAAALEDPLPPDDWGPYDVGVTRIEFVDERGKELVAEVWYPASVEAFDKPDGYTEVPILTEAYRDVPAIPGAFPLVAFTHGHLAIRYQSIYLTEYLASHGFVVVSPDHPGDTFLDGRPSELWQIVLERPQDIISTVDEVTARSAAGDDLLGGVLPDEVDEYAIVGHSLGSINALLLGGAEPDWAGFTAFCDEAETKGERYEGCRRLENVDVNEAVGVVSGDPRITVTVPMSPGAWYAFGKTGLSSVSNPLLLAGDLDDILPYESEALPFRELLADGAFLTFENTGHYSFSDICVILPVWDECEPDGTWIEVDRAQDISRDVVTAWIRAHMLDEQDAHDWLDGHHDAWPEVTWEEPGSGR